MMRIYLLQNLYDMADDKTVAEVIDSRAFSDFCGVDSSNQEPSGDTLGRFRNLLIRNGMQELLFKQVVAMLTDCRWPEQNAQVISEQFLSIIVSVGS